MSKKGNDGVAHLVVFVHQRHPAPLVKGGAGVRNTEADQIAHLQRGMLGTAAAQIGVLVVQGADLPVRWRSARHGAAPAAMPVSYTHLTLPTN